MAAVSTTLKLEADLKSRLKRLAEAQRRTPHWVMREAIAQYVDREEKREAFRRSADESWRNYQETGLHLTGEEVDAWLETWGTERETSVPPCHE